jgi:hypothetical protein
MKANLNPSRRVACVGLLIGVGLSGCAEIVTTPSLQRQIEAARSRADHEALVTYYIGEATTARDKAAEHRAMARRYQAAPATGRGGASMPAHCNSVASSYDAIATQYDGMATGHRQLAAQAQP